MFPINATKTRRKEIFLVLLLFVFVAVVIVVAAVVVVAVGVVFVVAGVVVAGIKSHRAKSVMSNFSSLRSNGVRQKDVNPHQSCDLIADHFT